MTAVLNEELTIIERRIYENKLILNIFKAKSIVFGSNYSLRREPELKVYINNILIQQVKETKLLGIILDNKLSWSKHNDNTVKGMGKVLAVVRRCRKYFTSHILQLVLSALFFSQLDYCQIIWG